MRLYELTKQQAYDKYGGRDGARKAQKPNTSRIALDKGIVNRLNDIVDIRVRDPKGGYKTLTQQSMKNIEHLVGRDLVTIKFRDPKFLKQSGIYIWMHDDYGIFYLGIAGANNLKQRWDSHLQKILGRVHSSVVPRKWAIFGKELIDRAGDRGDVPVNDQIIEDLDKLRVAIYPIIRPEEMDKETFKKELEKIESRLVNRMNPRLNAVSATDKKSVTRNPNQ